MKRLVKTAVLVIMPAVISINAYVQANVEVCLAGRSLTAYLKNIGITGPERIHRHCYI